MAGERREGGGNAAGVGRTVEDILADGGTMPDDFVYKPTPDKDDDGGLGSGLPSLGGDDEGGSTSGSFWEGWVTDYVRTEIKNAAKNLGIDYGAQLSDFVNSILPGAHQYVRTHWADYLQGNLFPNLENPMPVLDAQTRAALDTLGLAAMNFLKDTQPKLTELWRYGRADPFNPNRGGGKGGGGGGGAKGLSAADFDLDYITEQVQELWRAYLLDDNKDPRAIASAYVNARVAKPESPLELETFVLNRIRNTGRYRSIYRSKPEGIDELSFMNRYLSTARQYLSEGTAQGVAIGGAQFNAAPGAFQERISREREVQTTAPFIAGLEQMLSDVNGVLRG